MFEKENSHKNVNSNRDSVQFKNINLSNSVKLAKITEKILIPVSDQTFTVTICYMDVTNKQLRAEDIYMSWLFNDMFGGQVISTPFFSTPFFPRLYQFQAV